MTEACDNLIPSAKQPCIECPFRVSNGDLPAPQAWYDQDNFERVWAAVAREGKYLPCHMFDTPEQTGYDSRSQDMGLQAPVDLGKPKECAGMTAMIHRELRIAATYPNWSAYVQARPTGLQREAFVAAFKRATGEGTPLTVPADPNNPDVMDPATRVDPDSLFWKLGDQGINSMLGVLEGVLDDLGIGAPPCDCPVCENHATVHPAQELRTATGETVQADAALHPLLDALNSAGIRTTASCEDFHGAMTALWPEQIPTILSDTTQGPSYRVPLQRREAVIRFENRNQPERNLIRALRGLDWLHLSDGNTQAQITFPLHRLPDLIDLTRKEAA